MALGSFSQLTFQRVRANLHAQWAQQALWHTPPSAPTHTQSTFSCSDINYISSGPRDLMGRPTMSRDPDHFAMVASWWQERLLHSHEEHSSEIMLVKGEGTWYIPGLFLVSNYNERFKKKKKTVTRNDLPVFRKLVIFQCPQIGSLGIIAGWHWGKSWFDLKVWFFIPFLHYSGRCFVFGFVFNESFVDSATKSIVEARIRLFVFAPASSPQDRGRSASYIFP